MKNDYDFSAGIASIKATTLIVARDADIFPPSHANVRRIFDFFEFEAEIERMREANILYLVVSKFCDVDLHPRTVPNEQMGLIGIR